MKTKHKTPKGFVDIELEEQRVKEKTLRKFPVVVRRLKSFDIDLVCPFCKRKFKIKGLDWNSPKVFCPFNCGTLIYLRFNFLALHLRTLRLAKKPLPEILERKFKRYWKKVLNRTRRNPLKEEALRDLKIMRYITMNKRRLHVSDEEANAFLDLVKEKESSKKQKGGKTNA